MKCGNQSTLCGNRSRISILYIRLGSPASEFTGTKWFDAYWYMGRDDHKLTFRLALIKFPFKPVITGLIKRAISISMSGCFIFTLSIVEHNNLDGHIGFRLETITGKVTLDTSPGKTVPRRF